MDLLERIVPLSKVQSAHKVPLNVSLVIVAGSRFSVVYFILVML